MASTPRLPAQAGRFALWHGHAVAVEDLDLGKNIATVRFLQRRYNKHGEIKQEPIVRKVNALTLEGLTRERAAEVVSDYNGRIHALNECLLYME